jgi:hypothetical protein
VFILGAFLLIQKESVLGLDGGDLIVQSQEIVFEVFELEEFLFK